MAETVEPARGAVAKNPRDAAARGAHGRHLFLQKRFEEAARELAEAHRLDPTDSDILLLLAESHFALGRFADALGPYERWRAASLANAGARDVLRRIRKCKEALGYPLSDEERKAGRRWWPFGAERVGAPPPPSGAPSRLLTFGVLAALLAAAVAIAAGVGYWKQNHVPVYFDSALPQKVTFEVDGETFPFEGIPVKRTLAPGAHRFRVLAAGKEIERYDAKVEASSLVDSLFSNPFYVYDAADSRIYRDAVIGYGSRREDQFYRETLVAFQRFIFRPGADYVFREAPERISVRSRSSATKTAFQVATGLDYNGLATIRFAEGKSDEAEKALRKALALEPCHARARSNIVSVLEIGGRLADAVTEARAWVEACPDAEVPAHRSLQEARLLAGEREDVLLGEYARRAAERPENAGSQYLLGRLLPDSEAALARYREASRLDPALPYAHMAAGYALLELERYGEAFEELKGQMKSRAELPALPALISAAAVGAGALEEGMAALGPRVKDVSDGNLWGAQFRLLLGLGKRDDAARMLDQFGAEDRKGEAYFAARLLLLEEAGDEAAAAAFLEAAKGRKELKAERAVREFERHFNSARYAEAAAGLDAAFPDLDAANPALLRLYAVAARALSRDPRAEEARAGYRAALASTPLDERDRRVYVALLGALDGTVDEPAALRAVRRRGYQLVKDAYFFLGVRAAASGDAANARRLFERSVRTTLDVSFPLPAARRLAKG